MEATMRWGKLIFLCAVALIAFFCLRNSISSRMQALSEEETNLRVQLSEMRDETAELQSDIASVGTESYIESRAREEYQFIKEGEMRFEFTNPDALYTYTQDEADTLAAEQANQEE